MSSYSYSPILTLQIFEIITRQIMHMEFECKDIVGNNPALLQPCLTYEALQKERTRIHLENVAFGRHLILGTVMFGLL
jgi:hypothetical protein